MINDTIHTPGQIDTLHHREVLHENISVGLGAEVAHSVADAQLDGSLQGSGCRLGAQSWNQRNNQNNVLFNMEPHKQIQRQRDVIHTQQTHCCTRVLSK